MVVYKVFVDASGYILADDYYKEEYYKGSVYLHEILDIMKKCRVEIYLVDTAILKRVEYFEEGRVHNELGPARIYYNSNGKVLNVIFALHGLICSQEQWFKALEKDKQIRALFHMYEWNN